MALSPPRERDRDRAGGQRDRRRGSGQRDAVSAPRRGVGRRPSRLAERGDLVRRSGGGGPEASAIMPQLRSAPFTAATPARARAAPDRLDAASPLTSPAASAWNSSGRRNSRSRRQPSGSSSPRRDGPRKIGDRQAHHREPSARSARGGSLDSRIASAIRSGASGARGHLGGRVGTSALRSATGASSSWHGAAIARLLGGNPLASPLGCLPPRIERTHLSDAVVASSRRRALRCS